MITEYFRAICFNFNIHPITVSVQTNLSTTEGYFGGLIYLDFSYSGKTQEELLSVWLQEAKAALGGKKSGKVVDLWKVVGERKVKRFAQIQPRLRHFTNKSQWLREQLRLWEKFSERT